MNEQLERRPSPAPKPHPLTFHDGAIWIASWETNEVCAIDPQSWNVRERFEAPGKPFGICSAGDDLRVVISHGEQEDRYLYRLIPGRGFDLESKTPCPDLTGSYLAFDGSSIFLGQMTMRRIVQLNADATVKREIPLPARCAGFAFGPGGRFYMIGGDDELEHLQFGTLDISGTPQFTESFALPDEARSLGYDGTLWWTALRDLDEIASFKG